MDPITLITLIATILGLITVFISAARYFTQTQQQIANLRSKIENQEMQEKIRNASSNLYPQTAYQQETLFNQLLDWSLKAQIDIQAEIHSISIPVPPGSPTHLRIILSTDPESPKVVGREFKITDSILGWVFSNQRPYLRDKFKTDPKHFPGVDKAAGTKLSEGPILAAPILTTGGRCLGVIAFFRSLNTFEEKDIIKVERYMPMLSRFLIELEQNPTIDVPSIARGNRKTVSILFTDIRHFSKVLSTVNLDASATLLNEYYTRLLDVAFTNGGKFQEYVGDGIYVSFCLDTAVTTARAAVTTAIQMQKEYKSILDSWEKYQHPVSHINTLKIGLATGEVYWGMIGHSKERQEKIIGPPVNIAAHLCEDSTELQNGILIDTQTAELLVSDKFAFMPVDTVIGKAFTVKIT